MIPISQVSKSLSNYAPTLNQKDHDDFAHYVWSSVKDDDVYDVNLDYEWRRFKGETHPYYKKWKD